MAPISPVVQLIQHCCINCTTGECDYQIWCGFLEGCAANDDVKSSRKRSCMFLARRASINPFRHREDHQAKDRGNFEGHR